MRLLIIDDSREIRNSLKKTLSPLSNIEIVGEAADVQTSIDLIQSLLPQIVVLDFQLEDGTALEVLKPFSYQKEKPIFIIFSNFPANQYGEACLKAGADHFFNKSHNLNEFLTMVMGIASEK
ncbi:MAG: response regulator transcription factor [Calditrichaeota bacterium]|nr:response regulator transcription factor [Calditrichota bacterium]